LIVDDEAPARRRLRELLDDCSSAIPLLVVGEAASGREALTLLDTTPAELVLSDIHMPDMDGIELARHLLKLPVPPVLIFTTACHEHAIAAFEVHAIDYLVKPVRVQRLLAALQKVPRLRPIPGTKLERLPAAARRFLSVTERSRVVLIPIEEVVYLKAELKYVTIRTAEREYLLEESLTKLEEEFGQRFVRVHRNCLVARDAIRGFERHLSAEGDAHWEVLLRGVPEALPDRDASSSSCARSDAMSTPEPPHGTEARVPRTLICGSLAVDTIMVFPDRFARHILPEQTHVLSVSFQIGEMRREWGGCAGNITYNLKALGGEPVVMATIGDDGEAYVEPCDDSESRPTACASFLEPIRRRRSSSPTSTTIRSPPFTRAQ
jgi:two-component system response regulator AlgR